MSERKNKGTILRGVPDSEVIDSIARHEGLSEHFYRDHLGNVTVGYGRMVPNREKARDIYFYDLDAESRQYATDMRRQDAFDAILKRPYGMNIGSAQFRPSKQNKLFNLKLEEKEAKQLLMEDLSEAVKNTRKKFSEFDDYPNSAQKALLDMEFNMGSNKFQRDVFDHERKNYRPGWAKLFDAIEARDWRRAAKESNRKDVNKLRNQETYQLFMESIE
jgi:GH24 family phage-related lysozyme (muramidase)